MWSRFALIFRVLAGEYQSGFENLPYGLSEMMFRWLNGQVAVVDRVVVV